jgi:sugar/nucleoside kinase (ribokinase family)
MLMMEALRWANAAGAVTVTRNGAFPSLPTAGEVETLL